VSALTKNHKALVDFAISTCPRNEQIVLFGENAPDVVSYRFGDLIFAWLMWTETFEAVS
jgi:hypothetical protein